MIIDFTEIITWAISAVSVVIAAVVSSKIIPLLKEKGFYDFTAQMVKAASTYFLEGQGRAKFDWVFDCVDLKYGQWFDVTTIKNAIQAAYVDLCVSLGKEPSPSKDWDYAP